MLVIRARILQQISENNWGGGELNLIILSIILFKGMKQNNTIEQ